MKLTLRAAEGNGMTLAELTELVSQAAAAGADGAQVVHILPGGLGKKIKEITVEVPPGPRAVVRS